MNPLEIPVSGEVVLKPGRERPVLNRHRWIFSGAISRFADMEDGAVAAVKSHDGRFLGFGYFSRRSSIAGRMLNFDNTPPAESIRRNLLKASALRKSFFAAETNAFRLVNAEADGLPGVVVDRYDDVLVLQLTTLGADRLRPLLVELLDEAFRPRSLVEKSDVPGRREEGLEDRVGVLRGEQVESVRVMENGIPQLVDPLHSQKTGLFLDQREMRLLARRLSAGRNVLNAFCYTGGFTVAALVGGAKRVVSVDTSATALELAVKNAEINGFKVPSDAFVEEDVFDFLRRNGLKFDVVILDPPAFAKKKSDVVPACRGYKDLNRLALKILPAGGLLLTFSCSHFVDETLFRQVVFQAALEAGRDVRLLQRHRQAFDHPVNIFHPESEYLKGFLLYVED